MGVAKPVNNVPTISVRFHWKIHTGNVINIFGLS